MSMSQTKTDNANLPAKLALRRHFLDKYHRDTPPRVMDCCAGSGVIWSSLRREYEVASYWAIDVKAKRGRMQLDSSRVLQLQGWQEDVIDVDAYGSPWQHWLNILQTVDHPVTVFLTIGQVMTGLPKIVQRALGVEGLENLQPGHATKLFDPRVEYRLEFGLSYLLTMSCVNRTIHLEYAARARTSGQSAAYVGVRLGKTSTGDTNQ